MFRGRRAPYAGSLHAPWRWRETLKKCLGQPPERYASRAKSRQNTLPEDDGASTTAEKSTKSTLRGRLSLDNGVS